MRSFYTTVNLQMHQDLPRPGSTATTRVITADALRKTLNMPKTNFPMRADGSVRELQHVDRITTQLYARQAEERADRRPFVLHDGPPYANGDLHMGHLQNKVLKDIINRFNLLAGRRVCFAPGWDCHGLPIELKALSDARSSASAGHAPVPGQVDPVEIRKIARQYALGAASAQAADFKRWGILADWDTVSRRISSHRDYAFGVAPTIARTRGDVYLTMDTAYEVAQLRSFADMVAQGCVYRAFKPVYWSPSTHTALAEAELEYADAHISTAIIAAFPLLSVADAAGNIAKSLLAGYCLPGAGSDGSISADKSTVCRALVWTTTPWTLPANVALAVNPTLQYVLVRSRQSQSIFLVAEDRLEALQGLAGANAAAGLPHEPVLASGEFEILGKVLGADLEGCRFAHPLAADLPPLPPQPASPRDAGCAVDDTVVDSAARVQPCATPLVRPVPIICGSHVTADAGTGIVHTAPGHGHDDFDACSRYNAAYFASLVSGKGAMPGIPYLPALSPVDDRGCFTAAAGALFAGMPVLGAGNAAVLERLGQVGALVSVDSAYRHRYPYDWRSKKPVIVRATRQWFVSVDNIVARCRAELDGVTFVPEASRNRLVAFLGSRSDWCISRQRSWGVPVPVLFNSATGEPLMTPDSVRRIASVLEKHPRGVDAWWTEPADAFLEPGCGPAGNYTKSTETLDVWFDSGCSWAGAWAAAAGSDSVRTIQDPSDMVLEGSDQHRGWFQSSLLTSVAATGRAPYRCLLVWGFITRCLSLSSPPLSPLMVQLQTYCHPWLRAGRKGSKNEQVSRERRDADRHS